MTLFRPCIDLHAGSVKQIVGGTLSTSPTSTSLITNHISPHPPSHFAALYRQHALHGAHVIMLGPGNADAARAALAAWPDALQIGGGINDGNAAEWISAGASKVIVTSFLFPGGKFSLPRLEKVVAALGGEGGRLVVDLSCRRKDGGWWVAMDKWQTVTDVEVNQGMCGWGCCCFVGGGLLTRAARVDCDAGAVLLRVFGACGGQRGVAEGDRRGVGEEVGRVVYHPRDVCGRRAELGGFGAGQEVERWKGGLDDWERAGLLWWERGDAGGVCRVE